MASSTKVTKPEHRNLIIALWFRILCHSKISIQDIANVIIHFGDQYEAFITWSDKHNEHIGISEDALIVAFDSGDLFSYVVCGQVEAVKGAEYHWKIKILKNGNGINVGIVENEFYEKNESSINKYFWETNIGYSWYSNGSVWHNSQDILSKFGIDDIVDIWLDEE